MGSQRDDLSPNVEKALGEAAARWFARMHAPNLTPTVVKEFEVWLAESPDHAISYRNVQRFWGASRTLIEELSPLDLSIGNKTRLSNYYPMLAKLAAVLLIVAGISVILTFSARRPASVLAAATISNTPIDETEYSTDPKTRSSISLPDGSLVVLNVGSAIRLRYTANVRALRLIRGQALFEVAKHQKRPFYVYAGDRRVIATGTTFDVRLNGPTKSIEVTLVEGSVIVDEPTAQAMPGIARTKLDPGERLIARYGLPPQISTSSIDEVTNWRTDRLVFSNSPLRAVIVALNRYGGPKILLSDEKMGDLRIDGTLRTNNSIAVAHAIAEIYSLRIVEENQQFVRLAWK